MSGDFLRHPVLKRIRVVGDTVTIPVSGKKLIIPTRLREVLIGHNEYALDTDNIADLPWGGSKAFSAPPDNVPGTVRIISGDECYLLPTDQSVKSKVLNAGFLAECGYLNVNDEARTITEEFVIQNDCEGEDVQIIDTLATVDGWTVQYGTDTSLSCSGSSITFTGTSNVNGIIGLTKLYTAFSIGGKEYVKVTITSETDVNLRFVIASASGTKFWAYSRFPITAGVETTFCLPVLAPAGSVGSYPSQYDGVLDVENILRVYVGIYGGVETQLGFTFKNLEVCNGTWAVGEISVPDNLLNELPNSQNVKVYSYVSGAYDADPMVLQSTTTDEMSCNGRDCHTIDGVTMDGIYGYSSSSIAYGMAAYASGVAGDIKSPSGLENVYRCDPAAPNVTYSPNRGAQKRIGFAFKLPPYANGNPNLCKIQLKLVVSYTDENGMYVPDLSGNGNSGTIIGWVTKLSEGGLQFGGSIGSYVIRNLSPDTGHVSTIEARVKFKPSTFSYSSAPNVVSLLDSGAGYEPMRFEIGTTLTQYSVWLGEPDGERDAVTNSYTFNVDTEYDVVIGYRGLNDAYMTINGAPQDMSAINIFTVNGLNEIATVYLGCRNSTNNPFAGSISYFSLDVDGERIIEYAPTIENMGVTTFEFSNDDNLSTGLQHLAHKWIAVYTPSEHTIDYLYFTSAPKFLSYKQDEDGEISEIQINPGNGHIYRHQMTFADLSADSDSDMIPNFLSDDHPGSLMKLLQAMR